MTAATFHSIWTLILFISILGVIVWAYSNKRKAAFKEAANLVFADEEKEKQNKTGEE